MDAARQVFKKHRRARRRQPGKQGRLFRGSGRRYRRCGYRQELNDSSEPARKGATGRAPEASSGSWETRASGALPGAAAAGGRGCCCGDGRVRAGPPREGRARPVWRWSYQQRGRPHPRRQPRARPQRKTAGRPKGGAARPRELPPAEGRGPPTSGARVARPMIAPAPHRPPLHAARGKAAPRRGAAESARPDRAAATISSRARAQT